MRDKKYFSYRYAEGYEQVANYKVDMCLHKLGACTLDCWSNNSQKLTHTFLSTGAAMNFPARQSGSSIANHVREERACVYLLASRSSTEKLCCLIQDELSLQQIFFICFLRFSLPIFLQQRLYGQTTSCSSKSADKPWFAVSRQ